MTSIPERQGQGKVFLLSALSLTLKPDLHSGQVRVTSTDCLEISSCIAIVLSSLIKLIHAQHPRLSKGYSMMYCKM
jgi:hypothetical protein